MQPRQQNPRLVSDVTTPLHQRGRVARAVARPQQYASNIIAQPTKEEFYARFYRKSVATAQKSVAPPAAETALAHQAVAQAKPVAAPTSRTFAAPAKKTAKRRFVATRRTANILVAIAVVLSGTMMYMMYRYHLALQKVEAIPIHAATLDPEEIGEEAPDRSKLGEDKNAAVSGSGGKLAAGAPYTISIPKLKINGYISGVGVTKKGAMNAPGNIWQVGWYKMSATPSENTGVVIMNGHVHGPTQPGIFANLKNLKAGDIITVKDMSGTNYEYKVLYQQTFKAGEANESLMQSASTTKQGLNLVTCSGEIKDDEYQSRLVVFAERV